MARVIAALFLLSACQTYDFERVTPFTVSQVTDEHIVASRQLKPNMMLLVDNSFSMELPTDPSAAACPANCGKTASTLCPPGCSTRVSELKVALGDFLSRQATVGRFGVTKFPQPVDNQPCHAASNIDQPLPAPTANDEGTDATLVASAAAVDRVIQTLRPNGGTPTAASLDFVGSLAGLTDPNDGRADFVVLLTDGLPNCRDAHPEAVCDCGSTCSAARLSACACTQGDCLASRCSIGCLDDEGSVQAVRRLSLASVRTIVIGFGAEVNTDLGLPVLNALAEAGGFPRRCPNGTTAECGGGACDVATKLCDQKFFSARNGAELSSALAAISAGLPKPCEWILSEKPSRADYLSVVIDGQTVFSGAETYAYDWDANVVTFQGALCHRLETSTPRERVNVEFRIVRAL
jgi:hypothetical protein